jgi:hypothetical protein
MGPVFLWAVPSWSGQRESNPHEQLGKLPGYHYIMPACAAAIMDLAAFCQPPIVRSRNLRWGVSCPAGMVALWMGGGIPA